MEWVVFIVTAIIALVSAVAMLFSKNAIHSALFLLLDMVAISVLYLLLRAPFLFAVQLIVYAGAIMVLFLFVVMLLGAERAEDEDDQHKWQRPLAITMAVALVLEAAYVFFSNGSLSAPITASEDFATPVALSEQLFTTYLLPFEVTSVLLLAALVGVVVLHQHGRRERS